MNKRFTLRSINGIITLKDYGVNWQCNLDDEEPEVIKEINEQDAPEYVWSAVHLFFGRIANNLNELDENPFTNEDDIQNELRRVEKLGEHQAINWFQGCTAKHKIGRFYLNDDDLVAAMYKIYDSDKREVVAIFKHSEENLAKCQAFITELNKLSLYGNLQPLEDKLQEVREEGI